MKALRWYAKKDIRLEDMAVPPVGPDQVKVKVKWCGICGSDIHEYQAGPFIIPTKPHPMPGSKMPPIILGHEFSGVVTEVGANVKNTKVGERVAIRPTMPCYQCYWCKKGKHIQCSALGAMGGSYDGAFSEYSVIPSDCVYKMPDKLSFEDASLAEPLACAVHAVRRSGLRPGDSVAVIGAGPIGLLTMQVAKASGAASVYVVEVIEKRSKIALELGAEAVFNPTKVDAGKEIAKATEGRRVDIAFECVGSPEAMMTALKASMKGGTILAMGMMEKSCDFPFLTLFLQEKTIIASQGYTDEFPTAISYLADGRVNVAPLITAKIKLDDIIEKGFKVLTSDLKLDHFKIIVTPE